jgi:sugar lactone lactonase YvrE
VQASAPFIYISVTGRNQVAKLDTVTGQKMWQVNSYGTYPSRTAVAFDYSVWVGNRGFGDPGDANQSNVVHLDLDGNFLCRGDVLNIARSVAIDAYGNVWAGSYNTGRIYNFDGAQIDASQNPPRCKLIRTVESGVNIYGMAIDGRGFLYTASAPNTVKVDVSNGSIVTKPANPSFYGVAVDKNNNVWFGGWSGGGNVHRMLGDNPYTVWNTSVNNVTAVTVHPDDGTIWGSSYGTNEVVKIDPNNGSALCRHGVSNGTNPHGVAVDGAGKVWTPLRYGGYANRWTKDCQPDGSFPVDPGQELYTYSDMTGVQLRTITTKEGHWVQEFDSGYASPVWYRAEWTATANPPDTGVEISFKAADTAGGLQSNPTATCGPFQANQSPADLTTCPFLSGHRWLEADVKLWTKKDGVRPKFSDLKIFWARP